MHGFYAHIIKFCVLLWQNKIYNASLYALSHVLNKHLNPGVAGYAKQITYSLTQFIMVFIVIHHTGNFMVSFSFLFQAAVLVHQNIIMLQFTERARHSQLGVEDAEERSVCFSNEYLTILSNLNTNPT